MEDLAKPCDFKAVDAVLHRDESIRNAFITGLSSSPIRERLLENIDMTLQQAVDQARSMESAHRHANQYSSQYTPLNAVYPSANDQSTTKLDEDECVNAVSHNRKFSCYFCGGPRHERSKCPANQTQCKNCGKMGHYARVCRGKKQSLAAISATLAAVTDSKNVKNSCVTVQINGNNYSALIDTGSSSSFVKKSVADSLSLKSHPCNVKVLLASSSSTYVVSE